MMWGWNATGAENTVIIVFWSLVGVAYLVGLVSVIRAILRDNDLGDGAKTLWALLLIFVPFVAILAYVLLRLPGVAARHETRSTVSGDPTDPNGPTHHSPSDEITKARALADAGVISEAEFAQLKQHALTFTF